MSPPLYMPLWLRRGILRLPPVRYSMGKRVLLRTYLAKYAGDEDGPHVRWKPVKP